MSQKKPTGKMPSKGAVRKPSARTKPIGRSSPGGPSEVEIAQAAYFRWLARGGDHGDHEKDWLEAEQDLLGKRPSTPAKRKK